MASGDSTRDIPVPRPRPRPEGRGAATIHDVARAAGVSTATVSRVLSGSRPVGDFYASAVLTATKELGYRGDPAARALRRRTTEAVGIVVPDITNPFFPGVVQAIERALSTTDNGLVLCDSANDPDVEAQRISTLLDRRVDGLILIPCHTEASAAAVTEAAERVPVVQVDRAVDGPASDFVGVDDGAGIDALVDHLVREGRTRLAFVGAQPLVSTASSRSQAFVRRVGALLPNATPAVLEASFTLESGEAAITRLLESPGPPPDAIVCANDLIGLGALRALHASGRVVPDDVAVTGFDDIGFATVSSPALTTARQPVNELGQEGVRLLLARLGDPDRAPRSVSLVPRMVVRDSSHFEDAAATPTKEES